jgi:hypothetical protein
MRARVLSASQLTTAAVVALCGFSAALPLGAQTCTVPASHATIQEAADDPACAEVVLSAQTYPESVVLRRTVTVAGPGTGGAVIQGLVLVAGSDTTATLRDLEVANGCTPDAVRATGGAELLGETLTVTRSETLPCPLTADTIFTDGFETGTTGAWSSSTP